MKIERGTIPVQELRSLGKALSKWEAFRKHFTSATGLEIDLIQALLDRWESVAGRIQNPLCKELLHASPACEKCAETFAGQIQQADQAKIGVFSTCSCFAGQMFSVTRLTDQPNPKVYLLVGRVPPQSIIQEKYNSALKLASILLPQLQANWEKSHLHNALGITATLRRACCFIHDHHQEQCHVINVAKYCGVSRDWLSRHFKKGTGHSLPEFVRQCRLETAAQLLTKSDKSVTEVCFESGFQSVPQFNRLFHKEHSMSPTTFRERTS